MATLREFARVYFLDNENKIKNFEQWLQKRKEKSHNKELEFEVVINFAISLLEQYSKHIENSLTLSEWLESFNGDVFPELRYWHDTKSLSNRKNYNTMMNADEFTEYIKGFFVDKYIKLVKSGELN